MHVLALDLRLRLPHADSLKAKRSVIRPITERLPNKLGVAVAEVDDQNEHRFSRIAVVAVSGSARQTTELIDEAERFVWSRPDLEVLDADRTWMEVDR
jgi:uncharacterized protein YlxP (DUF503 family)